MKLRSYLAFFIVLFIFSISQAQVLKDTLHKTKEQVPTKAKVQKDSVIDGKVIVSQKSIPAIIDSTSIKKLMDLPEASELDEKWLEELYSNNLFDTIYKKITYYG